MGRPEKVWYRIHSLDTKVARKHAFIESKPLSAVLSDVLKEERDAARYWLDPKSLYMKLTSDDWNNLARDGFRPNNLATGVVDLVLKNKSGKPVPKVSFTLSGDDVSLEPFAPGNGIYFRWSMFTTEKVVIHTNDLTDLQLQWRYCRFDVEKFEEFYYAEESLRRIREAQPAAIDRYNSTDIDALADFSWISRCQNDFQVLSQKGVSGKVDLDSGGADVLCEEILPKRSVHEDRVRCIVFGRRDALRNVCESMPGKVEGWEWDEWWNDEWWGIRNDPAFDVYLTHVEDIEAHVQECEARVGGGIRVEFAPSYYVCEESICEAIEKSNLKTEFMYAVWLFLQYGADESKKIDKWRNGGEPPLPGSWVDDRDVGDVQIVRRGNGVIIGVTPALYTPKTTSKQ